MKAGAQKTKPEYDPGNGDAQEKPELDELQKNVLSRLRKVEGQIRGIQRMVENGKECEDILVQFRAVRSALKSTTGVVLSRYLKVCHARAMQAETNDEAYAQLEKTVKVLTNFMEG
ncbi:MAG: metal-sensitive transcriptional regulator [Desulfovibrionales bacterium]